LTSPTMSDEVQASPAAAGRAPAAARKAEPGGVDARRRRHAGSPMGTLARGARLLAPGLLALIGAAGAGLASAGAGNPPRARAADYVPAGSVAGPARLLPPHHLRRPNIAGGAEARHTLSAC